MALPDEPNLVLPLATSYNERGVAGFTHTVTNSEDQRKVNCIYEPVKNMMTGKGTLTLVKRAGVTLYPTTFGGASQTAYLQLDALSGSAQALIYIDTATGDIRIASVYGVKAILATASPHVPFTVDFTAITNAQNIVVQLKNGTTYPSPSRVFFSTVANFIANGAWTEIADADYTGFSHVGKMEHLDGYALQLTSTNLILNSDLNSLANWTATGFLAKQIKQDNPAGLARLSNQIIAFGDTR